MPYDSFTVKAAVTELNQLLTGGKINKVLQPEKDEVILAVYNGGKNYKLLLNCGLPAAFITQNIKQNPSTPYAFCMAMRKHLSGGTILSIEQKPYERVIIINIENLNELYDTAKYKLIMEIMGRQSNIILCNSQNKIINALKNTTFDSKRPILINLTYNFPQNDRISIDSADAVQRLKNYTGENLQFILSNFMGFSLPTAEYILKESNIYSGELATKFNLFVNRTKELEYNINKGNIKPNISWYNEKPLNFYIYPYNEGEKCTFYDDINSCLDFYYNYLSNEKQIDNIKRTILSAIKAHIKKTEKKIAAQKEKLLECNSGENYRISGELITANLYKIKVSADVTVENYYDNNKPLRIKLDENLSPSQNAQMYYKKYNKLKNAKIQVNKQLEIAEEYLSYLNSLIDYTQSAQVLTELEEIKEEIISQNILSKTKNSTKKVKAEIVINKTEADGFTIYWGKNNIQNDYITFKLAKPYDLWFHIKSAHGRHVILSAQGKEPTDNAITAAAEIAANGSRAEIDYTYKKYVKKPHGAKPGFVIYTNYKTILIKQDNLT
ncbi:MAG: NFACT RNA binding domain-containing protein [Clostridia bacterium]|nr:NFACT RNA binding domain-containing protein [Clostridia bacterium]